MMRLLRCSRRYAYFLALFSPAVSFRCVHGAQIAPVYSFSALGGQYFYGGQKASLMGNLSAMAAPGIRFNKKWELFPTISSS